MDVVAPVAQGNDVPAILDSDVVDPVVKNIINTLDPVSYLTLAMASKGMRARCCDPRVKKFELKKERMRAGHDRNGIEAQLKIYTELSYEEGLKEVKDVDRHVEMLEKMQEALPVTIEMECVEFAERGFMEFVDFPLIDHASRCLKKMGVTRVARVEIDAWLYMWRELVTFIQEFHVKTLSIARCQYQDRGIQQIFQQNVNELICNPIHPGTNWILGSAIPRIHGAPVSRHTLKPIFDMWMTTTVLEKWSVRVEDLDEEDLFDCVNEFDFYDVCPAPLPAARPLVFADQDEESEIFSFFIVREDDRVLRMAVVDPYVTLYFPSPEELPLAARDL